MFWPAGRNFISLLLLAFAAQAAAAPIALTTIGAKDRQAIVDEVIGALDDAYVFPETAHKMGERLRQQLGSGAYDRLTTLPALAAQLTEDLRGVSHDPHLEVTWAPAEGQRPSPEELQARMAAHLRRENYWFREVKLLPGNVGYLKLDGFAPADLAGSTAVAAMGFLAGSEALIVDLRENDGGSASMVQLLLSYLLPGKPTHFSSFYVRKGDRTDQLWTQAWVPGPRLTGTPVYVLTGPHTFSAAEGFAYSLKSLKRATIVGEATRGGAHPVDRVPIQGYPLVVSLPFGRSVNPVTGSNWEGTGVAPDVAVPAAEALAVAHSRALATIAEKATDPEVKATAALLHQVLEGRRNPVTLPAGDLAAFVGAYGPVQVTLEGGALHYQLGTGPRTRLLPIGNDKFLAADSDDLLLRFERDASGKVVRVIGVSRDGELPIERSGGGQ
ncbi:MAG TPA: S41 family peptidase [Solirubrobacterales bacterium]|nr:S41 family peptidase [Solirubrobacterales bacterium]